MNLATIVVRVSAQIKRQLERLAARDGISLSEYVRTILRKAIHKD